MVKGVYDIVCTIFASLGAALMVLGMYMEWSSEDNRQFINGLCFFHGGTMVLLVLLMAMKMWKQKHQQQQTIE